MIKYYKDKKNIKKNKLIEIKCFYSSINQRQ